MANKKKKQKYTSLVGVKWTQESLLNCLSDMYYYYLNELLNSEKYFSIQKVERISHMNKQFHDIYLPILRDGVTVKKE